jgi:hypothetical protein
MALRAMPQPQTAERAFGRRADGTGFQTCSHESPRRGNNKCRSAGAEPLVIAESQQTLIEMCSRLMCKCVMKASSIRIVFACSLLSSRSYRRRT